MNDVLPEAGKTKDTDQVEEEEDCLDGFFKQMRAVHEETYAFRGMLSLLRGAYEEGSKSLLPPDDAAARSMMRARFEADVIDLIDLARRIRAQLELMDRDNLLQRARPSSSPEERRVRGEIVAGLRAAVKKLMVDFRWVRAGVVFKFDGATEDIPDGGLIDRLVDECSVRSVKTMY